MADIRNPNAPKKGDRTTVDPIRDIKDVKAIAKLLSDSPRDHLLFVMGVNNGLRAGDLLRLKVGDVKKLVGNRIRELRKERGLTQEELGYQSGLHYTHIGSIERGEKNWSINTLVKVAGGLNVKINDLFDFPEESIDLKSLKKSLNNEINTFSPETLKIFSDLVRSIKSLGIQSSARKG